MAGPVLTPASESRPLFSGRLLGDFRGDFGLTGDGLATQLACQGTGLWGTAPVGGLALPASLSMVPPAEDANPEDIQFPGIKPCDSPSHGLPPVMPREHSKLPRWN